MCIRDRCLAYQATARKTLSFAFILNLQNRRYATKTKVTIKWSHLNVNNFIEIGTGRWNRTTDVPLSGECYNLLNYTSLEVQMEIEPTFIGLMRPLHYLICD